jgi:hypothetical protein
MPLRCRQTLQATGNKHTLRVWTLLRLSHLTETNSTPHTNYMCWGLPQGLAFANGHRANRT